MFKYLLYIVRFYQIIQSVEISNFNLDDKNKMRGCMIYLAYQLHKGAYFKCKKV